MAILQKIRMEVLLLRDIKGVGKKNDLIVVGDGFALNCLLPGRVALVATPLVRKRYADSIRQRAEEREQERSAQAGVALALQGKSVKFVRKITKTGKLYAAITTEDISEALKISHGLKVSPESILVSSPIKSTGTFQVQVKLSDQVAPLSVIVEAEKAK